MKFSELLFYGFVFLLLSFNSCFDNPRDNIFDSRSNKNIASDVVENNINTIPATISAPENLSVSDGTSTGWIALVWSKVAVSPGQHIDYEIWRSTSESGTYELINSEFGLTSYNDMDANECTIYYYKVRAELNGSYSEYSNIDSGWRDSFPDGCSGLDDKINAPVGIAATDGDWGGAVLVTWSSVSNADHYFVYRSDTEGGDYVFKEEVGTAQIPPTYSDWSVDECSLYWYKVRAVDSNDNTSDFSNADSGYADIASNGSCK